MSGSLAISRVKRHRALTNWRRKQKKQRSVLRHWVGISSRRVPRRNGLGAYFNLRRDGSEKPTVKFTQTREAIDRLGDEAWESAREVDLLGDKLARTGRGHTDFTCSTEGASRGSHIFTRALGSQTPSKEVLSHVSVQTSQRTSTYFLNKLRDHASGETTQTD